MRTFSILSLLAASTLCAEATAAVPFFEDFEDTALQQQVYVLNVDQPTVLNVDSSGASVSLLSNSNVWSERQSIEARQYTPADAHSASLTLLSDTNSLVTGFSATGIRASWLLQHSGGEFVAESFLQASMEIHQHAGAEPELHLCSRHFPDGEQAMAAITAFAVASNGDTCIRSPWVVTPGQRHALAIGIDRVYQQIWFEFDGERSSYLARGPLTGVEAHRRDFFAVASGEGIDTQVRVDALAGSSDLRWLQTIPRFANHPARYRDDPGQSITLGDSELLFSSDSSTGDRVFTDLRLREASDVIGATLQLDSSTQVRETGAHAEMRLSNLLYSTQQNEDPDDLSGHVWASIGIVLEGNTAMPKARYCLVRSLNATLSQTTGLLGDDISCLHFELGIEFDTRYSASIEFDAQSPIVRFRFGDQLRTHEPQGTVLPSTAQEPEVALVASGDITAHGRLDEVFNAWLFNDSAESSFPPASLVSGGASAGGCSLRGEETDPMLALLMLLAWLRTRTPGYRRKISTAAFPLSASTG